LLILFKLNQSLVHFLLIGSPRIVIPRLPIMNTDQRRYLFARLMSVVEAEKAITTDLKCSD
jgi:hypothetical protein